MTYGSAPKSSVQGAPASSKKTVLSALLLATAGAVAYVSQQDYSMPEIFKAVTTSSQTSHAGPLGPNAPPPPPAPPTPAPQVSLATSAKAQTSHAGPLGPNAPPPPPAPPTPAPQVSLVTSAKAQTSHAGPLGPDAPPPPPAPPAPAPHVSLARSSKMALPQTSKSVGVRATNPFGNEYFSVNVPGTAERVAELWCCKLFGEEATPYSYDFISSGTGPTAYLPTQSCDAEPIAFVGWGTSAQYPLVNNLMCSGGQQILEETAINPFGNEYFSINVPGTAETVAEIWCCKLFGEHSAPVSYNHINSGTGPTAYLPTQSCDAEPIAFVGWGTSAQYPLVNDLICGHHGQPDPVDCVGSWGEWGACTATCGGGTQSRSYTLATAGSNGGDTSCPSQGTADQQACNTNACPVDCAGSYGAFGACSATCGGGTHTKHFSISTHAAHGGAACPASSVSQSCNTNACPVDCVGDFGEYGACSVECGGGTKSKHFHVTTAAAHGGAACAHADGYTMTETCGTSPCIEPGLVLEAWDNVNGRKHLWHKEDGSLNHVIHGADLTAAPEAEDAVPSRTCKLNTFEAPVDSVADGGERISGFFTPPATGEYTFSLSADDGGKLYLGTSAESAAAIAQVGTFLGEPGLENGDSTPESTRKYWDAATVKEIGAVSDPQTLHGGTRYYISAVEVNRQGRDALSVAISGGPWEHAHGPIPVSHNGVAVLSHTSHGHLETCA